MAKQWQHNPLGQKTGAPLAAGRPGAFAWEADKTQHVIYVGADNQVHELWFRRGGFNPQWQYGGALSVKTGAPAAAAGSNASGFAWEGDKTQHIVYRGQDNEIHELWYQHGLGKDKWEYGGALNAKCGAPAAAGDPLGYAWEEDKTQHIIYRGQDNNIHELWFKKGLLSAKWEYGGALNAKLNAPAAAGDPAGFAWEHDKTQHVIYRGTDGNIHELYFQHGLGKDKWFYGGALNAKCGAPAAAGEPMGYAWEQDKTQHIVYRGADNNIHELWFTKGLTGAKWAYGGAISAKTGAPVAAGDPWGFSWEGDKTQHIVYRGQDGQIHELWFRKELMSAEWKYGTALSRVANGPAAASDPLGFAWEDDNTQHVVYRAADNGVHELWFRK
jgi:hypothetical protein